MLQQSIKVGRSTFLVGGTDLADVLKNSAELQTIARRMHPDATLSYRKQDGYDFYEAILLVNIGGETRRAIKQLGNSEGTLFLAANEPWRVYVPDADYELVRFDYLTDDVKEWGFGEDATKTFVPAKSAKKGKLRVYKPVEAK